MPRLPSTVLVLATAWELGCPIPSLGNRDYHCSGDAWCDPAWKCVGGLCRVKCAGAGDCPAGAECSGGACALVNGAGAGKRASSAESLAPSSTAQSSSGPPMRSSLERASSEPLSTAMVETSSTGSSARSSSLGPSSAAATSHPASVGTSWPSSVGSSAVGASSVASASSSRASSSSGVPLSTSATASGGVSSYAGSSWSAGASTSNPPASSSGTPWPLTCPWTAQPPTANAPAACNNRNSNLVACYSFDADDALIRDGSMLGLHGTVTPGSPTHGASPDGQALSLDGNTQVNIPMQAALNVSNVTLEAWVYPTALPVSGRMGILDKDGQYGMFIYAPGLVSCLGGNGPLTSHQMLTLNTWVHVACTYDGTNWRLYQDGIPLAATLFGTAAPLATGNANALTLGSNSPSGDGFKGLLDRVRIWNVVRSTEQICLEIP